MNRMPFIASLTFPSTLGPVSFSYVLLMQTGYGYSPLATAGGLAILGGAFGIVLPGAGRLTSFGGRRIMMAGVLVGFVGMLFSLVLFLAVAPVSGTLVLSSPLCVC